MASEIPSTMRAYQFASTKPTMSKNLYLNSSAPVPKKAHSLPADQVLVKVLAAALNPVDYKFPELPILGRLMTGSPATPSIDYAGRVVSSGPNSKKVTSQDLQPGQLVFGRLDGPTTFGTLAEYTIAPRAGCAPIPSGVSVEQAAAVGTAGITAYQCIVPNVKSGDRVFINGGSGGTGTFGIQIAKAMGCHVVTSCSGKNVELCKSLGADEVIDYKSQDLLTELKKKKSGSTPFDLMVDNVGTSTALYYNAHTFLKPTARYVQIGAPEGMGFVWDLLCRMFWPGALGGGKRPYQFLGAANSLEAYETIGRWMSEGKVKAVVDEVCGMEDKAPVKAIEKMMQGRNRGKLLVKIAEE